MISPTLFYRFSASPGPTEPFFETSHLILSEDDSPPSGHLQLAECIVHKKDIAAAFSHPSNMA